MTRRKNASRCSIIVLGLLTALFALSGANLAHANGLNMSHESVASNETFSRVSGYHVYLPGNQNGYTLSAKSGSSTSVNHGGSFTFVFSLWDSHSQSTPIITVNEGAVTVDSNGEYTISNITQDKSINVSDVNINTYTVSIPTLQEGYSLSVVDETETSFVVNYDSSRTIELQLANSHSQSLARLLVNDIEVSLVDNQYVLSNIREDKVITVADVTLNHYVITWDIEGVTSTSNVAHGDIPIYEGTPSKEATATNTYVFDGWSPAIVAATQNTTYTALFEAMSIVISASTPDEANGEVAAEISIPNGIAVDVHLKVRTLSSVSESIVVPEGKEIFKSYNASLFDEQEQNVNDQISGQVILRFAKPVGLEQREGAMIVLAGQQIPIELTVDGQFVVFAASSLGDFAIVVDAATGVNPTIGLAIGLSTGAALLLAGAAIALYLLNKKRKAQDGK